MSKYLEEGNCNTVTFFCI